MSSDLPVPHSAVIWRVDRLFSVALYAIAVIAVSVFLMHGWGLLMGRFVIMYRQIQLPYFIGDMTSTCFVVVAHREPSLSLIHI